MMVRRRTWLYRLAGQRYAQSVSFGQPVTAAMARKHLRGTVGNPLELWGKNGADVVNLYRRHGRHEVMAV
jgi:hypothetical protein